MRTVTLRFLIPKHTDLLAGLLLILTLGAIVYNQEAPSLEDLLEDGNTWFGFVRSDDNEDLCKGRNCI